MSTITVTINGGMNTSVQVGDMAYYCTPGSSGGFNTSTIDSIAELGIIESIVGDVVTCTVGDLYINQLGTGVYVLFSKNGVINNGSLSGYYAKAKFENDSTIKSEIFAAACEVFESSK
jgi:hypothetical protein